MRESGILMHISSLPGAYGVGSMGKSAYDFVDFLVAAGQSYWQILPLNPTGYGDSPYQSFSTFAGNHYLIDLDILVAQGLLLPEELEGIYWGADKSRVDFGLLYTERTRLLKIAHSRFAETEEYRQFILDNSLWLEDYALFMEYLDEKVLDHVSGSWFHQLDQENNVIGFQSLGRVNCKE